MTNEERVKTLHKKMRERQFEKRREAELRVRTALTAASAFLFVGLISVIAGVSKGSRGSTAGTYAGAMMLYENAGGYVLTAILAFALGVLITLAIHRFRSQGSDGEDQNDP